MQISVSQIQSTNANDRLRLDFTTFMDKLLRRIDDIEKKLKSKQAAAKMSKLN